MMRFAGFCTLFWISLSVAIAEESVGWRTDGSGTYPKAKPPTEWSTEKNVVWKTKLPAKSNATPVLAGKRLFTCAEPSSLLCLDRETGTILWQKQVKYSEIEIPADLKEKYAAEVAEVKRLEMERSRLDREAEPLRKKLRDNSALKSEIEPELEKVRKQRDALKTQRESLKIAERYTEPGTEGTAGYTSATPVTNGRRVVAVFGQGLVASYDLEGNRQWLKLVEHSTAAFAHSASPLLAGDLVLVHFADLVALRASDGVEVWRQPLPPSHGTSIVTKIGEEGVVIHPRGAILRLRDGEILTQKLGSTGANSPLLHGDQVFMVRGEVAAYQLPKSAEKPLAIESLWKSRVSGGGYWFPSPVIQNGLLFASGENGVLSAVDIETGEKVFERRLELEGTVYPSLSAAGGYLFVTTDKGNTLVLAPQREYKEIARNQLEQMRSSLVFAGDRLYVRTYQHLICIGK